MPDPIPLPAPEWEMAILKVKDGATEVQLVPNYTTRKMSIGVTANIDWDMLPEVADGIEEKGTLPTAALTKENVGMQVDGRNGSPDLNIAAVQTADVVTGVQVGTPIYTLKLASGIVAALRHFVAHAPPPAP